MQKVFECGIEYIIEFVKISLVVFTFFNIRPKKYFNVAFGASLVMMALLLCGQDDSTYSFSCVVISVAVISVSIVGKYGTLLTILSMIVISLVDIVFSFLALYVLHIDANIVFDSFSMEMVINSCSLVLIVIYIILFGKKSNPEKDVYGKVLPIYIIAALALTFYLSGIQILDVERDNERARYAITIGSGVALVVFVFICVLLNKKQNENIRLKMENEMNNQMLASQYQYYKMLLQKETETRAFRHDIRGHITCIQIAYKNGDYEELGKYIMEMESVVASLSKAYDTGNDFINAILSDLSQQFPEVKVDWLGMVPELEIAHMDVCTLFYNLLKNAMESASICVEKKVTVAIKTLKNTLLITVSNPYIEINRNEEGELVSTKKEAGHGYGVSNIQQCVSRYKGEYTVTTEDTIFCTEIILPQVVKN